MTHFSKARKSRFLNSGDRRKAYFANSNATERQTKMRISPEQKRNKVSSVATHTSKRKSKARLSLVRSFTRCRVSFATPAVVINRTRNTLLPRRPIFGASDRSRKLKNCFGASTTLVKLRKKGEYSRSVFWRRASPTARVQRSDISVACLPEESRNTGSFRYWTAAPPLSILPEERRSVGSLCCCTAAPPLSIFPYSVKFLFSGVPFRSYT